MKLHKLEFPKGHLTSLPEKEMLFFLQMGTILNDIYILHKLTLFSNKEAKTEVETKATNSQSFFLLLILSGKLYEGWGVLKDLFFQNEQKLSKEYEKYLPDEAKNDLEKIKKYFGKGNNLIFKIRNEFSFHYDPKKIKDALNNFPDDEPLEIYLSTSRANCLYYASTVLLMDAVLGTTGRDISDRESAPALKQFFDKVSNVTSWMSNFFYHCFLVVPKKLGWNQCPIKETVEIEDAPSIDDISLPYFIKKPK